ncbi:hypothetical protein [Methylococcus capsulatus]|jgi:hypothetical protein|uniref:Prophage MuMc02, structural protein P5 n=2 Tax=Methylococcus capsulatus TaxID=414 RepID=Q602W8_METCA|nr:hypothetical protein [Methylococcus capsulatus]AAU90959.1 prophage MuMc02, structural protein P5 [Methylococcus capsulatus str. Bath]QXP93024.1 hypothetical protein KW113_11725 [Methylococcus capsulatus]CAI8742553.1 Prophage MuMc02, structural protein P5 [Methylococcus capsulatus]
MSFQKPRGLRNNNPGNLVYSPRNAWEGQVGHDGRFARFEQMEDGVRALGVTLLNYQRKRQLHTVRQIITRWAPPNENDTATYIRRVAAALDVGADDRIILSDRKTLTLLVWAISTHENGAMACERWLKHEDVEAGVDRALR